MKSYCVKEKRETMSVPGSEKIRTIKNGRRMSSCKCASCGITKTQFVGGQTGGAIGNADFSCGYNLKGKRPGIVEECFKKGQIRRYGLKRAEDLDILIADRDFERKQKRRKPKKPRVKKPKVWTEEKKKQYVDEIVADIKGRTNQIAVIPLPTSPPKQEKKSASKSKIYE